MSFIYQFLHIKRLNKTDVILIYHRSGIFSMFGITHKANIIFLYQIKSKDSHRAAACRGISRRATPGPICALPVLAVLLPQRLCTLPAITTAPGQTQRLSNDAPVAPIILTALIIPITPRLASTAPTCAPQMSSNNMPQGCQLLRYYQSAPTARYPIAYPASTIRSIDTQVH